MNQLPVEQWEERYRSEKFETEPAGFLREVLPLLPRGRALDLAMGAGRNAVFLAEHGYNVTGIERSRTALEKAEALARERGVAVRCAPPTPDEANPLHVPIAEPRQASRARQSKRHPVTTSPGLLLIEADLEAYSLIVAQFDVVLCFYYLQRSLFDLVQQALRPGGMLVYDTYTLDQLDFSHGPRNPEHLLRPGELREAFSSLETLFYCEFRAGKGIASLLARKR